MSQPSIENQVKDLEKAGFPVRKGIRSFKSENVETGVKAVDSWLHRWAKHAAQNYAFISGSTGVKFLRGAGEGIPAIIVGIGPSLDLHYEALRDVKRRAILIATDAAYNPLLANDVAPDLIISFDCKKEQSELWKGMPTFVPMVFDSCAHPDVIASWLGPKLFFNHWHNQDEFTAKLLPYIYPHLGQIPSAGTVGNMALQLAMVLGCRKIATVGMDFCYSRNGEGWRYRCSSYAWPERTLKENPPLYDNSERVARSFLKPMGTIEEPDLKLPEGSKDLAYRTDPELSIYAKSFLNIVDHYSKEFELTHCSTWNIFGEKVKGGELKDWIEANCKKDFAEGRTAVWQLDKILQTKPSLIHTLT